MTTECGPSMDAVRRIGDLPCPAARRIAAEAFHHDPMWCYILPNNGHRIRALPVVLPLNYAQRYGEIWVTSPRIYGLAAWLPPGSTAITYWRFFRTGAVCCALHLGPTAFGRFLRLEVSLEEQHSRDIAKPHWYLLLLAVDPASQSCGVGGRLMAPVLRKAEANAIPAYVQTLYEGSVAFYERHGFRVTSKTDPSRGEPSCWGMIRP
jgi:ribosomal protein S18 acetylase RimI-like enzyme